MEFNYQTLKDIRREEIDSIKTKYIRTKVIPPKKSNVKPLFCVVWQSGRTGIEDYDDEDEQQTKASSPNGQMVQRKEADDAFQEAVGTTLRRNIIIGYLFHNQSTTQYCQEYVFHYSRSGVEMAGQLDEENRKAGVSSNSFFNSFLYRKIFQDTNKVYVSRGGMFPVFKEKLMALKNRSGEIVEESSKTGRSVLEVSTSDISNDFLLIGLTEKDIDKFYRLAIKADYKNILAQRGISLEVGDINSSTERKRAEKELKSNIREF